MVYLIIFFSENNEMLSIILMIVKIVYVDYFKVVKLIFLKMCERLCD